MSILRDLMSDVASHAMRTGLFDSVNTHEPKNAPGSGLHASVFADSIEPSQSSGLSSTSTRVVFIVRIYADMLQEPQDDIDPAMLDTVTTLIAEYHTDLAFLGDARMLDVLGADGPSLAVKFGYLQQDSKIYRYAEISLPIVVNDLWTQEVQ